MLHAEPLGLSDTILVPLLQVIDDDDSDDGNDGGNGDDEINSGF